MKHDISKLRKGSENIYDYLSAPTKAKEVFGKRLSEYILDQTLVEELKSKVKEYIVVIFSAEWCPDCVRNVPVLGLIAKATGLEVRVFGHLMRGDNIKSRKWAVPPSPPEVDDFNVSKIPLIVVLKKDGEEAGDIVENPPPGRTIEQALLDIMR